MPWGWGCESITWGPKALAFSLLRDLCSQALGPGRGEEGVLVHRIGPEICCL